MARQRRSSGSTSEQLSKDNVIGGRVIQSTDAEVAKQAVMGTSAAELDQKVVSKQSEIRVAGLRGKGVYAVVGVILIAIVFLIVKYAIQ